MHAPGACQERVGQRASALPGAAGPSLQAWPRYPLFFLGDHTPTRMLTCEPAERGRAAANGEASAGLNHIHHPPRHPWRGGMPCLAFIRSPRKIQGKVRRT